jgi:predicted secreted hydrolase
MNYTLNHGDHGGKAKSLRVVRDGAHSISKFTRGLLFSVVSVVSVVPAFAFDPVVPGKQLQFPRDYGAHPGHRIEWWYVTGHLEADGKPLGFQVTFFRVRNKDAESNPSRFAPKQILFAHAALADPARGTLLHAQKSGRFLEGLVEASTSDTRLRLDDWSMAREAGRYTTRIAASEFTLDLALAPTKPMILQGERGFSRKGETAGLASYYYSEPQLAVTGRIATGAAAREVKGVAWLDHEWSSEPLAADAAGWDWLGVNLDDGGALMAFRIRRGDGSVAWSHASIPGTVTFTPKRHWKSPRTGVTYPVAMEVQAAGTTWTVEPLMDDQELDARASTGTLYWEGAVRVRSAAGATGRGYLELTGYGERVPF